eukprot:TRINITY_DN7580_c0_g1_i11.p1 TRINITY_DN7580_c0_g1~~TRINITY_DN7580_c0_g1_i11.p1  ORF type:complete len:269 (+),score=100.56 TRINITY_DN7580_c0_g1_i11:118-924(+)
MDNNTNEFVRELANVCSGFFLEMHNVCEKFLGKRKASDDDKSKKTNTNAKPKKPAKPVDPNKPKKPPTAFLLYYKQQRDQTMKEYQGIPPTEVTKIIGKLWRGLPESEQRPFLEKANMEKAKYKLRLEEYMKDHPEAEGNTNAKAAPAKKKPAAKPVETKTASKGESGDEEEVELKPSKKQKIDSESDSSGNKDSDDENSDDNDKDDDNSEDEISESEKNSDDEEEEEVKADLKRVVKNPKVRASVMRLNCRTYLNKSSNSSSLEKPF